MRRLVAISVCVLGMILSVAQGQNHPLTGKDIYRINCGAIVGIRAGSEFGVGFIISADGRIVTANHVVATRESAFQQYAQPISVFVAGNGTPYNAQPVNEAPTPDQINYDSAVIKIAATGLPHTKLGNWGKVGVGDTVTILSTYPGFGCLLLQGNVVAKGTARTDMGPNPVDTVLFQIPIRNGFSGSPIFDKDGSVIGIEDTKVFGISPALDELRNRWEASSQSGGHILVFGIDIAGSFTQVINNLDQNLISGLGSGVNIRYAKELEPNERTHR